jgi:hypothetical protein
LPSTRISIAAAGFPGAEQKYRTVTSGSAVHAVSWMVLWPAAPIVACCNMSPPIRPGIRMPSTT